MRASFFFSFLLISFFSFPNANAQNGGKVSGRINSKAELQAGFTGATVSLLGAKDSAVYQSSLAGRDGLFSFENIANGKYMLAVSAVGHQKTHSGIFEITADNKFILLPPIVLLHRAKAMAGVTVIARRPLIEQKVDRTIVNVEASVTNVGATALEILEKSPGVSVDKDGNISMKGKEGVLVMIDGRPTQLAGADLASLLRNLNANQMDQIELMTNPPARYDAAGNAGVINIKTKKTKAAGYTGSVNLGYTQGRYPKTNEGLNFNYREGKVAFFTNLSHNHRKNFGVLTIQRALRNTTGAIPQNYFDQESNRMNEGESYNAKIGIDYFPNKKTSFGVVFNGFTNPSTFFNRNMTSISTSSKELESLTRATVNQTSAWKNFSTNVNFRRVFDSAGKELTSDVDYMSYDSRNELVMINTYFDARGGFHGKADTLQGALPQNIKIYSGRIDYLHPIKKGTKIEAGIKSSVVRTDNNAGYDSIQHGRIVHDIVRSNHFIYNENINAAYVTINNSLSKKIHAQLGLRLENTNAEGRQLTTGQTFDRHYTQLFPTAYFQYKRNDKNNFGLNYGRRLRRPNYESLNPFIRFMDRYTYSQGNPDLKPQFSHNIELTHTYHNVLTTTVNYTATNDIIQTLIEQKGQEAYAKQANIASLRQYGIAFNVNHSVAKWWTNNLYLNIYRNGFKGVVNNIPISFSATSLSMNGSQQFKLSKTLMAEISGFYRSAGVEGVIKLRARGMVSAGFSQQVMKNKGTLRVMARDIFYTQKAYATANYGNVDAAFQERGDSRVLAVGFTYRFSKGKNAGPRKRTSGSAGEEQNRVGID